MRVLLQLRPSPDVVAAVADPSVSTAAVDVADTLPGVVVDPSFSPVVAPRPIPGAGGDPLSLNQPLTFSFADDEASVLVRGEISDDEISTRITLLPTLRPDVVGVFADPVIERGLTCGGTPPMGDWRDVERLLHVTELARDGLDGSGVALAVLDTGINSAHVARHLGRDVTVDERRSWKPSGVEGRAGEFPVDHGTMCAFDALIAAPRASLIDVPVLLSRRPGGSALDGLLSDAVAAFAHLRTVLEAQPAASRSLVVSNSWGSFSPSWDFPAGQPRKTICPTRHDGRSVSVRAPTSDHTLHRRHSRRSQAPRIDRYPPVRGVGWDNLARGAA
ncbi:hypothetical protein OG884_00235 [Streptosporangium sp. NBC_01755]|uniref:hypothetical protein n=1 Tax=Streptosporangium sp. NBC_01755 TaxID=2975949 RepID=UPI002DD9F545|nr:hypothetical protein [Streptosporangium sp. NBC_01755]WSD00411.1 hypothetical protein OG884_00235 [Streptosporangium sp. NBC_01755]